MTTVFDVDADALITKASVKLKGEANFPRPEWSMTVKTGAHAERIPDDPDWWWVRAASILRKIYVDGPCGVQRLRVAYGGRKNRGRKPERFRKAGGKVLRTILTQFDELGFTEKTEKPVRGRRITPKGRSFLDAVAKECLT